MKDHMRIAWWTPFLIISAFLCGVLFALGHHFFYQSLDGNLTSASEGRGAEHLGQQINIAIGTLFAFIAKAAFILSITTTYYQVFWAVLQSNRSKHVPTLGWLDSAFSATSSVTSLLPLPTWIRYPVLLFVATSTWLIPIASIITPATLSVALRDNVANQTLEFVPQADFNNLNFVAGMPSFFGSNSLSPFYVYNGPSQITQQVATAVAAQDHILPIQPPHPNSTWKTEFYGPALKCDMLQSNTSYKAPHNMADVNHRFLQNIARHVRKNCNEPPTYISWFPRILDVDNGTSYSAPYFQGQNTSSMWCDNEYPPFRGAKNWCDAPYAQGNDTEVGTVWLTWKDDDYNSTWEDPNLIFKYGKNDFEQSRENASLYFAVLPSLMRIMDYTLTRETYACIDLPTFTTPNQPLGTLNDNITMLHCQLHNSTYQANFSYVNGEQSIALNVTHHDPVPIINLVRGPSPSGAGLNKTCTTLNSDTEALYDYCNFESDLLSQLAYQAVLQAFAELVTGNITLNGNVTMGPLDDSRVRSTSLINTRELRYLSDYQLHMSSDGFHPDLQNLLRGAALSAAPNMSILDDEAKDRSLQDAVEELFQNITVSLMSAAALRANSSSSLAPPRTLVTTYTPRTVYAYTAPRLLAAYAGAAALTLLCCVVGMLAIFQSGATYTASFSSVFRFAKGSELSVEIQEGDLDARAPLPGYLEGAEVLEGKGGGEKAPRGYESVGQGGG